MAKRVYDLRQEGAIVREQLKRSPNPVVEARQRVSHTILSHILLGLSDAGFYEYLAGRSEFSIPDAVQELNLDDFTFRATLDYLVGCGALAIQGGSTDQLVLTDQGRRYFNVYSRGVLNIYLGGYGRILHQLGDILAKRTMLNDPALGRSTKHAAAGTAFATCTFTIPDVFAAMDDKDAKVCLDLGCGSGDFLIQFVLGRPDARGIGIDISGEALEIARARADTLGVADQLEFHEAAVGSDPIDIAPETLDRVDIITAMYMLHEFGRDGRDAIVSVIRALHEQLPNRMLLALEVKGLDPLAYVEESREHYGRLDYYLIHALSGQGLPRPSEDWHSIFTDAGCEIVEPGIPTGGSLIYIART